MNKAWYTVYVGTMMAIGFAVFVFLVWWGCSYYATPIPERPFHDQHTQLKPSGPYGHGFGIIGTLMILVGVFSYIGRKRQRFLPRVGALKYWLEFHIFLCSVGPLLILFHTAFKFGGIVSVSFWSMVAVVASGIVGRFIYIQIPRTIHGRELSLGEIREMRADLRRELAERYALDPAVATALDQYMLQQEGRADRTCRARFWDMLFAGATLRSRIRKALRPTALSRTDKRTVLRLIRRELKLAVRIHRLQTMQRLFKYWHVAHLPFALIMLIIMVIHVAITLAFGYRWVF